MPRNRWNNRNGPPPAFTLVEALVAIVLVGMAGAALAASFTTGSALRGRATVLTSAAEIAHSQIAALASRSCAAADTSGTTVAPGASGSWTASRAGAGWAWSDSLRAGQAVPIRLEGAVTCTP